MEPLLFLSHRVPYPPEKGEKIRAWHILQHLAQRYAVHLGCLHDDPADAQHIPFLRSICADLCCVPLAPRRAKLRSLARLGSGSALTLGYFEDGALRRWVESTLRAARPRRVFVFSSGMADYVRDYGAGIRILDMVDVDSDKWRQYAETSIWPFSAIYAREHRTLLAFERSCARAFDATLLVSPVETALFRSLAPEAAGRIHTVTNGVDIDYFDPRRECANPYPGAPAIVFTGAMDYWPNIEGVTWFATAILPRLRARRSDLAFFIVGINPAPAVRRLAGLPGVTVTGRVADILPYLRHAAAVVAPLRIARGTQNKVLEAMAMARPVIATREAAQGITAAEGQDFLVAGTAEDFAAQVETVLAGGAPDLGHRARERILRDHRWNFDTLDRIMAGETEALLAAG
jgi:sugar transferase (PEP-CTERM/EpsH1 system associated)